MFNIKVDYPAEEEFRIIETTTARVTIDRW